jgi:hypothetical protein
MTVLIYRLATLLVGAAMLALLPACTQAPSAEAARRPQQAGQPLDPAALALRIASTRASALMGDQAGVQRQVQGMREDFRKSIKLPDPARRIDHESARTAASQVAGVRSVVWIDQENLLAMVDGHPWRSQQTIDGICLQLQPLGDTLGVVVNLQDATARTGDELEILSRNCQLAPGDRAFLQRNRQVDVIAPAIRAQQRGSVTALRDAAARKGGDDLENARALEAIPEM